MPGYLLDTNHLSAWENQHPAFMARLRERPVDHILWVCPISLAEIECGLRITATTDPQRRAACRRFVEDEAMGFVFPIAETTRDSYANIMERIWRTNPPGSGQIRTERHLVDLGVDVNDVWIAAVALERNLTLLTADAMNIIRACVPELRFDNWLV